MRQLQMTRQQRAARTRRRAQADTLLPLDPRDPDIVRAKQLQRQRTAASAGPAERTGTGRVRTPGT
jgi:hypothetical protein